MNVANSISGMEFDMSGRVNLINSLYFLYNTLLNSDRVIG